MTLFLVLSVAVTGLLLALAPADRGGHVHPGRGRVRHGRVSAHLFLGVPLITAYNIIASVFRGLGDSKRPMYFIAIACAVNIALDYLFIGALHMGPAGAALGTTLAQAVSVAVSLAVMRGARGGIALTRDDFRQRAVMGRILRIGVPIALQDGRSRSRFCSSPSSPTAAASRTQPPSASWRRSSAFLFLVPSSMLSTVSALGAMHRRGQAPPRAADAVVCHRRRVRLRRAHLGRHPVRRRTGRRALHA